MYLSQHRFLEAADVARRAIAVNQRDAWNYGVLGDAYVELGRYEDAFDAFDTMVRLRPDAASYARVAYAHELQGRLDGALRHMRMALEATGAQDPESLAWHHAQIGNLLFQMGGSTPRRVNSRRRTTRSRTTRTRAPDWRGWQRRAATTPRRCRCYRALMAEAATPELAATIGDLLAHTGDARGADEHVYEGRGARARRLEDGRTAAGGARPDARGARSKD